MSSTIVLKDFLLVSGTQYRLFPPFRKKINAMENSPRTADIYSADHLYAVAGMYYNEDLSQSDIAKKMGVSRPTISRMLAQARDAGIVRISIVHPHASNTDTLAEELRQALGLSKVYLAQGFQDSPLAPGMEQPTLAALSDMKPTPGASLVISSGVAMYGLSRMRLPPLHGITLVPAVGGIAEPEAWYQTNEIVRSIAEQTGATYKPIFARAIPAQLMHQALQEDDLYQEITRLWKTAHGAFVGIGSPTSGRTSLASDIPQEELKKSRGDVALHFFDSSGEALPFTGSDRTIRIPLEDLKQIPHTVAIAVGSAKVESIIISAGMGLYRSLVTDEATAKQILHHLNVKTAQ